MAQHCHQLAPSCIGGTPDSFALCVSCACCPWWCPTADTSKCLLTRCKRESIPKLVHWRPPWVATSSGATTRLQLPAAALAAPYSTADVQLQRQSPQIPALQECAAAAPAASAWRWTAAEFAKLFLQGVGDLRRFPPPYLQRQHGDGQLRHGMCARGQLRQGAGDVAWQLRPAPQLPAELRDLLCAGQLQQGNTGRLVLHAPANLLRSAPQLPAELCDLLCAGQLQQGVMGDRKCIWACIAQVVAPGPAPRLAAQPALCWAAAARPGNAHVYMRLDTPCLVLDGSCGTVTCGWHWCRSSLSWPLRAHEMHDRPER